MDNLDTACSTLVLSAVETDICDALAIEQAH